MMLFGTIGAVGVIALVVAGWAFLAFIPARLAAAKGRSFTPWFIIGLLGFSLLTLIAAAIIRPTEEADRADKLQAGFLACPYCAEAVRPEATVCRYCGRDLKPAVD